MQQIYINNISLQVSENANKVLMRELEMKKERHQLETALTNSRFVTTELEKKYELQTKNIQKEQE